MRRHCIRYVGLALSVLTTTSIYLLLRRNQNINQFLIMSVSWQSQYPVRSSNILVSTLPIQVTNISRNLRKLSPALLTDSSTYHITPVSESSTKQSKNSTYSTVATPQVLNESITSLLASRFPRVMIVGFGKAGTKALFEYLKQHPQLSGPEKELRYFSLFYRKGLRKYLDSLPPPPSNGFVIEKSPDYIVTAEAPHRIVTSANSLGISGSELKFIVVLRNPIDRAMSEYLEWNVQRRIKGESLLPSFHKMLLKSSGELDFNVKFINTSCYAHHLQQWFKFFNTYQVCYVDGNDFVIKPYEVMHRLEACLKLQPFFVEDNFHLDQMRGFYCYREYDKRPLCMGRNKGRPHPPIQKPVYHELVHYFREWDRRLANITEQKFSWFNGY